MQPSELLTFPVGTESWAAWLEQRGRGSLRAAGEQIDALKAELEVAIKQDQRIRIR